MTAWVAIGLTALGMFIAFLKSYIGSVRRSERTLVQIENMQGNFENTFKKNKETHERIWSEIEMHDDRLNEHETRISVIEKK